MDGSVRARTAHHRHDLVRPDRGQDASSEIARIPGDHGVKAGKAGGFVDDRVFEVVPAQSDCLIDHSGIDRRNLDQCAHGADELIGPGTAELLAQQVIDRAEGSCAKVGGYVASLDLAEETSGCGLMGLAEQKEIEEVRWLRWTGQLPGRNKLRSVAGGWF